MAWLTKIFYCNSMENELKSYHNKTNWANFLRMQDFWMLLKLDNTSWRKTLRNPQKFMQWPVVITLFQETKKLHNQKGWILENTKIGPVLEIATCCLHGKYGVEIRISSVNTDNSHSWVRISHGSNKFVMNLNYIEQEIPEVQLEEYALKLDAKDLACRSKAKAKPQRREPAGSSPSTAPIWKRTWTDVEPGEYSLSDYEISKKLIHLLHHGKHVHREDDGAVEFWRIKENLQKHFQNCPDCLMVSGRKVWQEEQEARKDTSTVLILQEKLCISELIKVIQDAILLILLYRTMWLFRATSSSTFVMSDVQSIYILSSIRDWYLEVKILNYRQTVFFLPVDPMDKRITRILIRSTWVYRVMHNTCIKHGRDIRTQYIGSTSILLWGKDWSSIRPDRMQSSFTTHSHLTVFRKLLGWKLEKSYTKKYTGHLGLHQRSPWNTTGKENWVQNMLNDQKDKLCNNLKVSNRTNQFQTQVVIERGNPFLELTREPCKMEEKRPVPRRSM